MSNGGSLEALSKPTPNPTKLSISAASALMKHARERARLLPLKRVVGKRLFLKAMFSDGTLG